VTGKRTYLDYNASAPLRAEARDAMVAALDVCGNPSSVHSEGRHARKIVEAAREEVASLVNARPSEVVFTSGATEANVWAHSGWAQVFLAGIEHDSVRAPVSASGAVIVDLAVSTDGVASFKSTPRADHGRSLLTLQLANNETGVIQDVAHLGEMARGANIYVHTDAVQAAGRIAVDFKNLGASSMSLSSHKIGGPKGAGALVIRDGVTLVPLIAGGGQERRRRAGTENVAAIAGFGAAARAAARELSGMDRVRDLRDRLESAVLDATPGAMVIGVSAGRLPNTSCIAWPGKIAETLVIKLDLAGIAVSAGAACSSGKVGSSAVLEAMGLEPGVARSAIRVSIGTDTTAEDIGVFLAAWKAMSGGAQIAA
jgi:cysteine desulfurase